MRGIPAITTLLHYSPASSIFAASNGGKIPVPEGSISIRHSGAPSIGKEDMILPTLKANPMTYKTEWSPEASASNHIRVSIKNSLGKKIMLLYNGEAGSADILRQTLNASTLTPGVYFVPMNSNGISTVQRLVVTE